MKAHRFDPISMLFGIIVVIVGFAAINSRLGRVINDRPDALIPLLLLVVGAVAVVVATRRSLQDVDGTGNDQYDSAE
jgi:formate hydrogenlyase subunit 3/multisubunit Na+/H+ antiporter MnhD subunit